MQLGQRKTALAKIIATCRYERGETLPCREIILKRLAGLAPASKWSSGLLADRVILF
jgi:hypothetical protein